MNERAPVAVVARNIVNQLFDEAGVPVEVRQAINDRCDEWVTGLLREWLGEAPLERMHHGCERWLIDENEVGYPCGTRAMDPCDACVNEYLTAIGMPRAGLSRDEGSR